MLVLSHRRIHSFDFTRGGFFLSQSATILLGKLDQYGACHDDLRYICGDLQCFYQISHFSNFQLFIITFLFSYILFSHIRL
ncbi:hypothetical protein BVU_1707 [Phocaeicola vulgatus ATCC 8482]|uniref:Uncharacterized protein n=1 Tax=Phocaeicola vulgatus (strain ATCC 8482 / DSM 1447 / JCM 5826 / CCUG 4940 / NBRC 14291 / NCTC 11154) TaxID=435590 RepID=A6L119_PHOV8|nr:hypothetical protein BVU_1707 [Phocaeicola vulgatus ATCC 8482]